MEITLGQRFGRLQVVGPAIRHTSKRGWAEIYYPCQCECGTLKDIAKQSLTGGRSRSCGCQASELTSIRSTTHGMSHTPIYAVWMTMVQRCHNPNYKHFALWGGRGIEVCDRWRTFEHFYADMGDPPFTGATIERKDNDLGYGPDNVRWATRTEQGRNKRNNRRFEFNGESLILPEWSERTGIKLRTLVSRLYLYGWTIERALTTKV